jgi:hypothetical protein
VGTFEIARVACVAAAAMAAVPTRAAARGTEVFPADALRALRFRVERSVPGVPCSVRATLDEPSFRLMLPTMAARGDWARGVPPDAVVREAGTLEVLLVVRLASEAVVETFEDDPALDGCTFEGAADALIGANRRASRWIVRFRFDRAAWSEVASGKGSRKVRDAMRNLVLSGWARSQLQPRPARLPENSE